MSTEKRLHLELPPFWKIWADPVVWRYAQSRMRVKTLIFWISLWLILTTFIISITYLTTVNREIFTAQEAARAAFLPLIIIQGVILMFFGTGSVAKGVVDEKLAGVLDYQRMSPASPMRKTVGYLFGLPIREYLLFALTLPHLAFLVWRGAIPFTTLFPVYLVFATSTLVYHLTGLVAGMVTEKWRWSARLAQVMVIVLNLILPLFSQLGFIFFEFLTIRPVLAEHIRPLLSVEAQAAWENLQILPTRSVPFFDFAITGTWFTLLVQGSVMVLFVTMLLRKWVQAHRHPLSKVQALLALVVFQIFTFGNLWPTLTVDRTDEASAALALPLRDEAIAIAIPLVYVLLSGIFLLWLILITMPDWNALTRGERRRTNLGLRLPPWRWDESSGIGLGAIYGICAFGLTFYAQKLIAGAGYYDEMGGFGPDRAILPLSYGAVILLFAWGNAIFEKGRMAFIMLIWWLTPLLVGMVLGAAFQDRAESFIGYVLAVSPLATVGLAALLPLMRLEDNQALDTLVPALIFGSILIVVSAGYFYYLWRRAYRKAFPAAKVPWY
jgi:hypothetical protein